MCDATFINPPSTADYMANNTPPNTPPTPLVICNLALSKLGESPLAGIDANGSPASRLCYLHYHPTRREVLCSSRWPFATRHAELRAVEPLPGGDHAVAHTLPADCLRVLEVNHPHWMLQGRAVYCPVDSLKLLYTADIEDTELFEPLFIDALALRLACKLCIPLLNSSTARQALQEEYRRVVLPQAAYVSAVQSHSNDSHPLYRLWRSSKSTALR